VATAAPGRLALTDRGLENERTYSYAIRAVRTEGETTAYSAPSARVAVTPRKTTPPGPPENLVAIPSAATVRLSWSPGPDSDVADVGTPAYVDSTAAMLESYRAYDDAFAEVPHVVCYSVKANGNLGVLGTLARAGAGADIVSGGELFRALRAGFPPGRIIFSGVGKTRDELREALKAEVLMFNVESLSELRALDDVAREPGVRAPVALR